MNDEIKHVVVFTVLVDKIKFEIEKMRLTSSDLLVINMPEFSTTEEIEIMCDTFVSIGKDIKNPVLVTPKLDLKTMSIEQLIELRDTLDAMLGVDKE